MTNVSAEEHARVVQGLKDQHAEELRKIQGQHVEELQKLRDTKNKLLKEQKDASQDLAMKLEHADRQMVESMRQIKSLAAELQDFKDAAKLIVHMVGPVEGEAEE